MHRTVEQIDLVVWRLAVAGHARGAQPVEDRRCVLLDVLVGQQVEREGHRLLVTLAKQRPKALMGVSGCLCNRARCHWLLSSVILSPKWIVTAFRVGFQPFILPTGLDQPTCCSRATSGGL